MLIQQARLEAEGFKKKAELEAEQKRRAANVGQLKANLNALKMQGAAEAANTEAIILEAAYEDKVPPRQNDTNLAPYPSSQHTGEYV